MGEQFYQIIKKKKTNTDFLNPAACNTKPTEIEPKASMTADSIQKHKTAHLWHLVCWKWFLVFYKNPCYDQVIGFYSGR